MYSHTKDFFCYFTRGLNLYSPLVCVFFPSLVHVYIYCNICIYTLNINSVYILYTYIHYLYAYMYICIHAHMHTRTRKHTHTHILTYTLILRHTHTYISRARVCGPRPYTHTSVASNKTWDCICIYKCIYMYTNLYIALDPTSQDECYPDP